MEEFAAFASAAPYKSALASELEHPDIGHRRPLRLEDLEFLKFDARVRPKSSSTLSSLASQRILRCLFDAPNPASTSRALEFFDAFALAWSRKAPGSLHSMTSIAREAGTAIDVIGRIVCASTGESDARRLLLVQERLVFNAQNQALKILDRHLDDRNFVPIELASMTRWTAEVREKAHRDATYDLHPGGDVYWQFYLPSTLALANGVTALARNPSRILELLGTFCAVEVARLRLKGLFAIPHAGNSPDASEDPGTIAAASLDAEMASHFSIEELAQVRRGACFAARLLRVAARDVRDQLSWATSLERNVAFAREIVERIDREGDHIDRETFDEPREMCSTTHVHDDHRLVVIENGDMVFWGWPGMRHAMTVGDALFVPRGRLHGSTVTSANCLYHQPIIPDDWVEAFLA